MDEQEIIYKKMDEQEIIYTKKLLKTNQNFWFKTLFSLLIFLIQILNIAKITMKC